MTNEQAIYLLKGMRGKAIQSESEALNMAIEALQKQVTAKLKNPDFSLITEESSNSNEQKSKLDLISRQDAIDAVKTYWKKVVDDIPKGVGFEELTQLCDMALEHNANILKAIDQLPSAQRTGEWQHDGLVGWKCSACGEHIVLNIREFGNYCPACGAKMKNNGDD